MTAIDVNPGSNWHWHIIQDDITKPKISEKFDFITCISVLEHITEPDVAMRNMFRLLNPGGHIILTFPYTETSYVRNVYVLPGSSYGQSNRFITQSFSRQELERWSHENDAMIIDQEYWQFWKGDHWTVGEQIIPPRLVTKTDKHQHTCIMMRRASPSVVG